MPALQAEQSIDEDLVICQDLISCRTLPQSIDGDLVICQGLVICQDLRLQGLGIIGIPLRFDHVSVEEES